MNRITLIYVPALVCAAITSGVAIAGAALGNLYAPADQRWGMPQALARWDGEHYKSIMLGGYTYNPAVGSRVAFFPAYPMAARAVRRLFGLSDAAALAGLSNACVLLAFAVMAAYLPGRAPRRGSAFAAPGAAGGFSIEQCYALLAMGLLPTTFFFRMAYSESMFLLVAIAALLAMARRWPLLVIAGTVGLATAVRPVGVGLLLPLAWHVRRRSNSTPHAAMRVALLLPLACSGLVAYMAFQYWRFGQPFAFALTQSHWGVRPPGPLSDKVLSLISWQPIWGVYTPGTWGYWWQRHDGLSALFNIQFAEPIYFVGTAALVAYGAWRRWLTAEEFLLSAALLAITYVTRAYEMCMASQGRFAAVVFPVYIVIGELLARVPMVVAVSILAFSGFLMAAYAALFAAGYPLI